MEYRRLAVNVLFRALDIAEDWPWIQQYSPICLVDNTRGIVAYDPVNGKNLAAMVCDSWTMTSVDCHIINTHPAVFRHGFHKECAEYLFTTADSLKVYGKVASTNKAALKLDKHLGFVEVARLKDAAEIGTDIILLELERDNCPYWTGKRMH